MNDLAALQKKITDLEQLLSSLRLKKTVSEKVEVLNGLSITREYLSQSGPMQEFISRLAPEPEYAIKAMIAIGQGPIVFNIKTLDEENLKKLTKLLEHLLELEIFYQFLGGIIGYHYTTISLIFNHLNAVSPSFDHLCYIQPEGLNLTEENAEVRQAIRWGIENIEEISFIYPLGGSGDRLNLKDETTGESLPAALLPFLGHTLLDGILSDLQAIEYLYFKLFKKQVTTPIAIMTSVEKNNHVHVLDICKKANWFGRGSENFYFFIQPLVPVITVDGNWSLSSPLALTLKPSGHGVLWKLAGEAGVFNWLKFHRRRQCLVRQINNPIAATDQGLLALIGLGCAKQKAFGFLSCERMLNSEEGTNVIIEQEVPNGYDYCLTNIEYTEFKQRGIGEVPANPGSKYSIYPTNTNILFTNIEAVQNILKTCPIPGQLINMKSEVPFLDPNGKLSYVLGGRLECTMQNIADHMIDHSPKKLDKTEYRTALQSFIVFNSRLKTISTTKKSYKKGLSFIATPEQAFYDILSNNHDLLKRCQFELPTLNDVEDYLTKGPSFIFLFHPGLGPLYFIITQKIRKGRLHSGAELQLGIAEVDIEDLSLEGSLVIQAKSPLGTIIPTGMLQYGNESRCTLKQVTIQNKGIDYSIEQHYWKNTFIRKEKVKIVLHEGAEFHAENIALKGTHTFEVPARHRLVIMYDTHGRLEEQLTPIEKPTWEWSYNFDSENAIQLKNSP